MRAWTGRPTTATRCKSSSSSAGSRGEPFAQCVALAERPARSRRGMSWAAGAAAGLLQPALGAPPTPPSVPARLPRRLQPGGPAAVCTGRVCGRRFCAEAAAVSQGEAAAAGGTAVGGAAGRASRGQLRAAVQPLTLPDAPPLHRCSWTAFYQRCWGPRRRRTPSTSSPGVRAGLHSASCPAWHAPPPAPFARPLAPHPCRPRLPPLPPPLCPQARRQWCLFPWMRIP